MPRFGGRLRAWALVSLALAAAASGLDTYIADEDRFPGWKGELPSRLGGSSDTVGFGELGKEVWRGRVEQISWKPRAFLFHNFLTDEECEHLKALSRASLTKSSVVDSATGVSVDSDVRTSSGTFLAKGQDDVVKNIEKRLSMITMLPVENGESLQILKYVDGQKYEAHNDYFHDSVNADAAHGGQRIATVLMYLETPLEGGETVFPLGERKVTGPEWSDCAKQGLAVKARKGNALLFYSLKPNGDKDEASLHGSCPTTKGEKWSATKWIHVEAFNMGVEVSKAKWGDCVDVNDGCAGWAASGECEKNKGYMAENCRKACGLC